MTPRAHAEALLRRVWRGELRVVGWLLVPLGWLWGLGAFVSRLLFRAGLREAHCAGVPVVSVGNLVVGGAGKTPVTLELARRLLAAGRRVAVLSRGYGRVPSAAPVVVSDGKTVRASAEVGGDEPVWLARRLPGLRVVVAARRAEAARVAVVELGADILLLDDGLSHRALGRDADVVVVDSELGLGNGRLLPAGPLREPPSVARGAALVWLTRCPDAAVRPPPPLASLPVVRSRYVAAGLVSLDLRGGTPAAEVAGRRVLAVCGIARPESFERTLAQLGANVRGVAAFADHHRFRAEDVARAESWADDERCELLVTTEKDAVRLAGLATSPRWRALRMDVVIDEEAPALDSLVRRFAPAPDATSRRPGALPEGT